VVYIILRHPLFSVGIMGGGIMYPGQGFGGASLARPPHVDQDEFVLPRVDLTAHGV
jgi:hypothetical protein